MARKTGSHSDITGPRIREAALRLFAREGYAAVSMRRIAAEVGVQAGALYLYTPDKQALLSDLMSTHLTEVLEALAALPALADPVARLDQFARFHITHHLERPEAVFIAYMELRNLTPENFAAVETLRRRYEQALQDILEDGRAQGVFRVADVRLATLALIAMMTGVTTWYREGGRLSRAEVAAHYADMALRSVRAGDRGTG
ncbi:MAG: TetR/AcrR family transcriptional regulator [Pseudorhodobacter sp.]